ncbi:hypothetical protein GF342_01670 [Candidatus Woesearchaeota archaeon]|nr:hypothetical protein [Candidatus Woesearchaeota archaeon]
MTILTYTFRTYPHLVTLQQHFSPVFVIGPLKKDLQQLSDMIAQQRPRIILGIAKGTTITESKAVNIFHKKKIQQEGRPEYLLGSIKGISINKHHTSSFCNYTAYYLCSYIEQHQLATTLLFVHIQEKDIPRLAELLRNR